MTPEELIAEAYRRYPPGSVFKSIFSDEGKHRRVLPYAGNKTVMFKLDSDGLSDQVIRALPGMNTTAEDGTHCSSNPRMYQNGVWCPRIESEAVKEIMERYE